MISLYIVENCASADYVISGPQQKRPSDFNKELRNCHFKEALVSFLISHWENKEMGVSMENKIILLNFDYCYKFIVDEN